MSRKSPIYEHSKNVFNTIENNLNNTKDNLILYIMFIIFCLSLLLLLIYYNEKFKILQYTLILEIILYCIYLII